MRADVVHYSGARHHSNAGATNFPFTVKQAAITIGVLGAIGWLGWLAMRLKAENSELEAQLLEIRGDQTYEMINQESLSIWQNAPEALKNAIPSDHNPVLALDPQNPFGVVAQINQLSHRMYGCYDSQVRLSTELKEWQERENHSRSLADDLYDAVTETQSEVVSCKNARINELKEYQKEKEEALGACLKEKEKALQECQTSYKVLQQSLDEKREYTSRRCEDKVNMAIMAIEEKKDKAIEACERQKNEQSQSWQLERKQLQAEYDTRLNVCNEKRLEDLMRYNKGKNTHEDVNADERIEQLQAELEKSRKELEERRCCVNSHG